MQPRSVHQTFTAALDALVKDIKRDRAILAVVLCGSLSHDTVWAKSDIDLVLVTIDDRKIATELSTLQRSKHTLYILDEPTTGLHLADVEKLLVALNRLVDAGHTVLLIEHHLDVIKTADHVIDLGPEGGHAGGRVVATGTPEEIAAAKSSHTGRFLKAHLSM
jgi:predicted nucleotidyltransferase